LPPIGDHSKQAKGYEKGKKEPGQPDPTGGVKDPCDERPGR
jgi:hypothetical protein